MLSKITSWFISKTGSNQFKVQTVSKNQISTDFRSGFSGFGEIWVFQSLSCLSGRRPAKIRPAQEVQSRSHHPGNPALRLGPRPICMASDTNATSCLSSLRSSRRDEAGERHVNFSHRVRARRGTLIGCPSPTSNSQERENENGTYIFSYRLGGVEIHTGKLYGDGPFVFKREEKAEEGVELLASVRCTCAVIILVQIVWDYR
jgi:hypothetical protein